MTVETTKIRHLDEDSIEDGWFDFIIKIAWPLVKAWKLILAFTILAFISSAIVMACKKNNYMARAHYMLASSAKSSVLGGLGGDVGALVGLKSGASPDLMVVKNILGTNQLCEATSAHFDFRKDWAIDTTKQLRWEDRQKIWSQKFEGDATEEDGVSLGFESKDSILAKNVVDFVGVWLDSTLREYHRKQSKANADFYLSRIMAEDSLLDNAERNLIFFQKKHKIVQPEEQMSQTLQLAGNLESSMQKLSLEMGVESAQTGFGSTQYKRLQEIQKRTAELLRTATDSEKKTQKDQSYTYRNIPSTLDLTTEYERLLRDVELHRKALGFMIQGREETMLEFRKMTPLLIQIDSAKIPSKKSSPPRSSIVIIATFFALVASCITATIIHKLKLRGATLSHIRDWTKTGVW